MSTTVLVIPDLQIPLHDVSFTEKLIKVSGYLKPDKLHFIGDLTDSTEVGRWVKGRAGEYSGQLQAAFDTTSDILSRFRAAVGDIPITLQDSNHDERTRKYIEEYAPALSSLRSIDFKRLAGLEENGVVLVDGIFPILPDTLSAHGHEGRYSTVPGKYGLDRVLKYGKNFIYGHTHTPHLNFTAKGAGDDLQTLWTMNVGHGMDYSKADYMTEDWASWCQAFGILTWDGEHTHPQLVTAQGGKFFLDDGEPW
jgi:hypothetical protein